MFEQLSKKNKLRKAKELLREAEYKDSYFQKMAKEDSDFKNGEQWTKEEKHILEEELRPVLTFNLTKSSCDLIMGMNEDNKIVHRASPFEPTDAFLCDVLNDLSDYVVQSNNFDEEQDGALESAVVCGRGWVAIDFQPDPKRFGEIQMTEIDVPVHEVHFDPSARRPTLEDASFIVWDRWMTQEDFKIRFPNVTQKKMNDMLELGSNFSATTDPLNEDGIPVSDSESTDYDREIGSDIDFYDRGRNMLRVVHMEYWEYYKKYFAFNPEVGSFVEIPAIPTAEQKEKFRETFKEEMTIETMFDKRVRWLQFIGDEILYDDLSPLPFDGFSLVPVIAYRDTSKRTNNHYGVVRLIKDPQREVNKRWSQALNMLNQQVQPGVYAETDAFVDEQQASQSMKVPGEITWTNAGAITGGKIKERTVPAFPNAPMQMEQFSQDIIKKITGINPDLLGQDSGRQEPGVVVRMRQQQGMTLLKPLFRNFNFAKQELFKRQLAIIMTYMPDQQILRVLGQNDRYQIQEDGSIVDTATNMVADLRDVRNLEYNVIAEPSSANVSKRMLELEALLQMQERIPVPPQQIIDKLEISATEKQTWLAYIDAQQQAAMEQQEEIKNLEVEFKDREIKVDEQRNIMDFTLGLAKISHMGEKDQKSMITKFAGLDVEKQVAMLKFISEMASVEASKEVAKSKEKEGVKKKDGK